MVPKRSAPIHIVRRRFLAVSLCGLDLINLELGKAKVVEDGVEEAQAQGKRLCHTCLKIARG